MRTNVKVAIIAVIAGCILAACGGSKSARIDREIALKKKQMELAQVTAEADMQKRKQDQQRRDLEDELTQKDQQKRKMVTGEGRVLMPCMEESYDKPGEYMGGFGAVEDRPDRNRAIIDANRAAVADIASRYIGMIKNAIEDYSKDVNVPSGKKMYESNLEGGAAAIGQRVLDKYANVVCRDVSRSATGGWIGYAAVHVYLRDAKSGLADELEVRQVDYDKKKFFEKMDAELDKQAAQRQAEIEAMRE